MRMKMKTSATFMNRVKRSLLSHRSKSKLGSSDDTATVTLTSKTTSTDVKTANKTHYDEKEKKDFFENMTIQIVNEESQDNHTDDHTNIGSILSLEKRKEKSLVEKIDLFYSKVDDGTIVECYDDISTDKYLESMVTDESVQSMASFVSEKLSVSSSRSLDLDSGSDSDEDTMNNRSAERLHNSCRKFIPQFLCCGATI